MLYLFPFSTSTEAEMSRGWNRRRGWRFAAGTARRNNRSAVGGEEVAEDPLHSRDLWSAGYFFFRGKIVSATNRRASSSIFTDASTSKKLDRARHVS